MIIEYFGNTNNFITPPCPTNITFSRYNSLVLQETNTCET
jgi:hypothetical protein